MLTPRRILDALAIVLGLWLVISATAFLPMEKSLAMGTMVVFGLVIVAFAMWGETEYSHAAPELLNILMGVLVFTAPWYLGFTPLATMTWNCWIVGGALFVLEAFALPHDPMMRSPHQPA